MGGRIAQLQVTGRVGDRTIFGALGATAHPRPGGLTGQYLPMPRVAPPDDCGPLPLGLSPSSGSDRSNAIDRSDRGDRSDGAGGGDGGDRGDRGEGSDRRDRDERGDRGEGGGGRGVASSRRLEFREAAFVGAPPPGALALWARLRGIDELTRAGVAYVADMVPAAVARAAGKLGAGFSLDNSLRFADIPPTEWVLLDLRGELASHGYGHGRLTAWTPDGALVATGSQTASMVHLFEADELDQWRGRST
jgi:hypothetical protein